MSSDRFERNTASAIADTKAIDTRDIIINRDKIADYFPSSFTDKDIENTIFSLLDDWKKEHADFFVE